ncbi:hypothetical protein [Nannocystis bainbridge]|uniref:Uncharacterized protein n=1 Tax=Nannocystis bainbridge TaxID=2995303 RepID=A0ABT5EAH5_9BACT|nr:hypothetical protein [Nannocystis bainbridge]MDC0722842.1 hypothetical protein [Nannocystis bainbridge]
MMLVLLLPGLLMVPVALAAGPSLTLLAVFAGPLCFYLFGFGGIR